MSYKVRLEEAYQNRIKKELEEQFNYSNVMEIPYLKKIVISRGMGAATADKKLLDQAIDDLSLISGQKPILTKSKVDISNFKLRKGTPIGAKVTLRRARMFEFLDRFINVATPRMRDFRGLRTTGFDGSGNYNVGIQEQIIFPEINVDNIYKIQGMDLTFVTSANTDEEALALLKAFGMPFFKQESEQAKTA